MNLKPRQDGSCHVSGAHSSLISQPVDVTITDIPEEPISFESIGHDRGFIGTISGKICRDMTTAMSYRIVREIFVSENKNLTGIRIIIENISSSAFNLKKIIPISCFRSDDFSVADALIRDWHIMRMARNKNDIPGCFRPTVDDQDSKDASLDSSEIPAGMGVSKEDEDKYRNLDHTIISEPSIFIKHQKEKALPGLFISVLGQDKHLSQLILSSDMEQKALSNFQVVCEFDSIQVNPGEKRATHWILFREEDTYANAVDAHNEMLMDLYKPSRPPRLAPSIFCTWYFYGHNFTEKDLEENLDNLKTDKVPFDMFLLDDGWSDTFGSWQAGKRFPGGMQKVAEKIKEAGYIPGIWTCPFVVTADSKVVKEHPELLARDTNGNPYEFAYNDPKCYAVDPTSPYAVTYFNEMYKRIREWGFTAHKFDFLRSFLTTDKVRFYNRKMNRAQAYRLGMQLVRNAIGNDSYILACGGLFEGSIGLVDGMRTGSDTRGYWQQPEYLNTIKQNVMRANSNCFWHTDPDAAMLRLRSKPFRDEQSVLGDLSLGSFTDEEAFTVIVNQYLGGGITCFSERFMELQAERKALYRHIIPAEFPVPEIGDIFNSGCPTLFLSYIEPRCETLENWWTLAVVNWKQEPVRRVINISDLNLPKDQAFILFEFKEQKSYGLKTNNDSFTIDIPPHAVRVMRIAIWNGETPVIMGTDLHITGGAVELADITTQANEISGSIITNWNYPVMVTAAFPYKDGFKEEKTIVKNGKFRLQQKQNSKILTGESIGSL